MCIWMFLTYSKWESSSGMACMAGMGSHPTQGNILLLECLFSHYSVESTDASPFRENTNI